MVVVTHQPEDGDNKNEDEVFGYDLVTQKKFSLKQSAFRGTFKPEPLLKKQQFGSRIYITGLCYKN